MSEKNNPEGVGTAHRTPRPELAFKRIEGLGRREFRDWVRLTKELDPVLFELIRAEFNSQAGAPPEPFVLQHPKPEAKDAS